MMWHDIIGLMNRVQGSKVVVTAENVKEDNDLVNRPLRTSYPKCVPSVQIGLVSFNFFIFYFLFFRCLMKAEAFFTSTTFLGYFHLISFQRDVSNITF